jgi:hypothetical protein
MLGAQVTDDPMAGAPTREEQETMAEILVLQEQIDRLIRTLSPDLQDTVLERLESMTAGALTHDEGAGPAARAEAGEHAIEPIAAAESVAAKDVAAEDVAGTVEIPDPVDAVPVIPTRGRSKAPPVGCNTLALFDSNGDGKVSANDRSWRHLYLWSDADGDGVMQDAEVQSAYDRGVRSLDVRLDTFLRIDGDTTATSEVEVDRYIVLDTSGDGFDSTARMIDDGVLVVDAGKLGRGDGPDLMDETGLPLDGLQAFRAGLGLTLASGDSQALSCP